MTTTRRTRTQITADRDAIVAFLLGRGFRKITDLPAGTRQSDLDALVDAGRLTVSVRSERLIDRSIGKGRHANMFTRRRYYATREA